jgi:spore maturation protein CgeB
MCRVHKPRFMLATGIAPLDAAALLQIGRLGVIRLNYLTDDPWNPSHRARWFMEALPMYDWIFSTRTSNVKDLERHGCGRVHYMPFGYDPSIHRQDPPSTSYDRRKFAADVAFAGGADEDRIPIFTLLTQLGFDVALYGGYWDRRRKTRAVARGFADAPTLRKAVGGAKVALCLVRRANRDGSSMRTFELGAMGACILAEHTDEHHQIMGDDGDAVVYFRSTDEMITKLRWLLAHDDERLRLAAAIRSRIVSGSNTYRHRLETMLTMAAS